MNDWSRALDEAAGVFEEKNPTKLDRTFNELLPPAPRVSQDSTTSAVVDRVINHFDAQPGTPTRPTSRVTVRKSKGRYPIHPSSISISKGERVNTLTKSDDAEMVTDHQSESDAVADAGFLRKADGAIQEQIDLLEEWVSCNLSAARKDVARYWALKLPALLSSVSITALESFGYGDVIIVMSAIAALCIGIDAAFPGGQLYNIHKRAANEARRLQNDILIEWRLALLGDWRSIKTSLSLILSQTKEERARIDNYITEAEASLGKARS